MNCTGAVVTKAMSRTSESNYGSSLLAASADKALYILHAA